MPDVSVRRTARLSQRRGRQSALAGIDVPTPLATLAEQHGLGVYRDPCRDPNIPGKWGEIYRHGPGRLAVQIGGPRAEGTMTEVSAGASRQSGAAKKDHRLSVLVEGNGEAVFVFDECHLAVVAKRIQAYRTRRRRPRMA